MITCISNNDDFKTALKAYFASQNKEIQCSSLPLDEEVNNKIGDVLILQEPIVINNNYLSVSLNWKKYLEIHSPNTILLIAGIGKGQSANYLDILNLPENASECIQNANKAGTDWMPVTTEGIDVEKKIHQFFEGHGDESFTDELYKILRICKIAKDELTIHKTDFESVREELLLANKLPDKWNVLQSRWQFYIPYFKGLPFFKDFHALNETLQAIAVFFTSDCENENLFWETSCVERLEKLKSGLEKIEVNYAR